MITAEGDPNFSITAPLGSPPAPAVRESSLATRLPKLRSHLAGPLRWAGLGDETTCLLASLLSALLTSGKTEAVVHAATAGNVRVAVRGANELAEIDPAAAAEHAVRARHTAHGIGF